MKLKLVNKSDKALPQEFIDGIMFTTFDRANEIAAEYNLRIVEIDKEYDGTNLTGMTVTIGDSYQ